jgi:hypothetical protein
VSTDQETTRIVRSWLEDGATHLPDSVLGTVLAELPTTPQRRATWWPARRTPIMNKVVGYGLAAAAVVAAVFIGFQIFGSPGGLGADPTPTATPEPTLAPTTSPEAGLPQGPFVITGADGPVDGGPVEVTVEIASSGWSSNGDLDFMSKGDDGLDAPETVGGALVAWTWPVGTEFHPYGDPCHWSSSVPDTAATTADEIAAGLAAQTESDPSTPTDVEVGGYAGKKVTLHTPMTYEVPGATREEEFGDCDETAYAYYGVQGAEGTELARNSQGPGETDELWILDVDGAIVILNAVYSPATPPDLVDELRTMAESATFETP